jgi:hypothetical protein
MRVEFKVTHFPRAERAHRYRYTLTHGRKSSTSEGYPSSSHAFRACDGLYAGFCALIDPGHVLQHPPTPYAKDSLLPRARRAS